MVEGDFPLGLASVAHALQGAGIVFTSRHRRATARAIAPASAERENSSRRLRPMSCGKPHYGAPGHGKGMGKKAGKPSGKGSKKGGKK
jgi:hypothetical protein